MDQFVLPHRVDLVKPLFVAFAGAFAIHAAAAASIAALGVAQGHGPKPAVSGQTIDIEPEQAAPIREPEPVRAPTAAAPARGAPHAQALQGAAPVAPLATSSPSADPSDAVPQPQPAQAAVAPARFTMVMSAGAGAPGGTSPSPGPKAAEVLGDDDVAVRARQIAGEKPAYPPEALAQGVELSAPIAFEIVVDPSGRVTSARELRRVGYGFDEAAAAALREYRFSPAMRGGHAVAVRMRWTVDFRFD